MDLGDLGEYLDDGAMKFALGGRHYTVPPVTFPTYLKFVRAVEHVGEMAAGRGRPEDNPAAGQTLEDFWAEVLSQPILDQLIADGVPASRIAVIVRGAHLFHMGQEEVAKVVLAGAGKASAPMVSTSTTPTGSTGTGVASTTRQRASSSGTKSPRKSSKQSGAAAKS